MHAPMNCTTFLCRTFLQVAYTINKKILKQQVNSDFNNNVLMPASSLIGQS